MTWSAERIDGSPTRRTDVRRSSRPDATGPAVERGGHDRSRPQTHRSVPLAGQGPPALDQAEWPNDSEAMAWAEKHRSATSGPAFRRIERQDGDSWTYVSEAGASEQDRGPEDVDRPAHDRSTCPQGKKQRREGRLLASLTALGPMPSPASLPSSPCPTAPAAAAPTTGDRSMRALPARPPAQGLYDPRYEHDACGVAFVATLTGEASHDIVRKALTALRNLDHRGAAGAEANSGDGAGILLQVPDAFLRDGRRLRAPRSRRVRRRHGVPRGRRRRRGQDPAQIEELADRGGPHRPRLARRTRRPRPARRDRPRRDAAVRQLFVAAAGARLTGMALERRPSACASAPSTRPRSTSRSLARAPCVYKGMLTTDQLDQFFPDLPDERIAIGAGRRALAVLDQHVPELAARPPVPLHRPQRRDQHGDGQPQLDAGPRGAARLRPDPRRPRAALPDLYAGRVRLGHLRRGARAAPHGRPHRCPTPC